MDQGLGLLLKPIDLVQHYVEACHVVSQLAQVGQIALDLGLAVGPRVTVEARVRLHPTQVLKLTIMIHHSALPPTHIAIAAI